MMLSATRLSVIDRPVTAVSVVSQVRRGAERDGQQPPLSAVRELATAPTWEGLRRDRAEALAELEGTDGLFDANTSRYLGLDRDQLSAMVYDRNRAFGLDERRSAQRQLQQNDRAYLDRASELSEISGDDRVLLTAQIELERLKSPIERAVPKAEQGPGLADMRQQLADKTAERGGTPLSISLRYPNGWAAAGERQQFPDSESAAKVSPGATRVALMYRESLF